jgi:hypothetical protein
MAEGNGNQGDPSRLDRIEHALELLVDDHRQLVRAHIVLTGTLDKVVSTVDEMGGKLNGLIGLVDHDHREFHERLKRLEEKQ